MKTVTIKCPVCRKLVEKPTGQYNRAMKDGYSLYCDIKCAGIARRVHKTDAQKKEEKRLYDIEYRKNNKERKKATNAAYFKKTYDPVKAAAERKKRMHLHVEYCRQPKYKAYKKEYDKRYRSKKLFGPFWQAHRELIRLEAELRSVSTRYEIGQQNNVINKTQKRRRDYVRLNGNQS